MKATYDKFIVCYNSKESGKKGIVLLVNHSLLLTRIFKDYVINNTGYFIKK